MVREGGGSDASSEMFDLWPENVPAWELFMAVQTQWRGTGMSREGLDRPGVHRIIDERRRWRLRRRQLLSEIGVMERAALEEWADKQRRNGG